MSKEKKNQNFEEKPKNASKELICNDDNEDEVEYFELSEAFLAVLDE